MNMRLLFTLSVKQTPLPTGRNMALYRVTLQPAIFNGGQYVSESASNAVVFNSVPEGSYSVEIDALDTAGGPLLPAPVLGSYVVAAPAPGPTPAPVNYFDAPTGFSVAALPVAL